MRCNYFRMTEKLRPAKRGKTIRFPVDVYVWVATKADENDDSFSKTVTRIIRAKMAEDGADPPPKGKPALQHRATPAREQKERARQ